MTNDKWNIWPLPPRVSNRDSENSHRQQNEAVGPLSRPRCKSLDLPDTELSHSEPIKEPTMPGRSTSTDSDDTTAMSLMEMSGRGSLLTVFLLQLEAILPLYLRHLSLAAATGEASDAAHALEMRRTTTPAAFGGHSPTKGGGRMPRTGSASTFGSSSPSSPSERRRHRSPRRATPRGDAAGSPPAKLAGWLGAQVRLSPTPLSPRAGDRTHGSASKASPRRRLQRPGATWNSVAGSEWARFVAPLLMLVGAEVYYGRLEHVLDPRTRTASPRSNESRSGATGQKEAKKSATADDDARGNRFPLSSPLPSPTDANKRPSRRLIAMYRQIRDELVIVGEYLCDPVLGSHAGGAERLPMERSSPAPSPPLTLNSSPRQTKPSRLSPRHRHRGSDRGKSGEDDDPGAANNIAARERRERAATSLRRTLDALISFANARCVLVSVHAELCSSLPPLLASGGRDPGDGHYIQGKKVRRRKWLILAEQCRNGRCPISAWAKEEDCWCAISDIENEMKAMELALTSIHYLHECNLFDCVLNVRKLHVLLGNLGQHLPIMFIRSSLPAMLSVMHVFFVDAGAALKTLHDPPLQPSLSLQSTQPSSGQSPHSKLSNKSGGGKPKAIDFNLLFAEFVTRHRISAPLAVVICRADERQKEGDKEKGHTESALRWEPIYTKLNFEDDEFMPKQRGQGLQSNQNLPTDCEIGVNQSGANVGTTHKAKQWPFNEWLGIEKVLTEHLVDHCSVPDSTKPAKHYIESVGVKKSVQASTSMHSEVVLHCHVSLITDSICLLVIQGINTKRHRKSDDDIALFMETMVSKLRPESILSLQVAMRLKSDMTSVWDSPSDPSETLASTDNVLRTSLWSESGWSDAGPKSVLHSMGLQRKDSPVMAPLKSPYVKKQISGRRRQRKKRTKDPINHAHILYFLGPELSNLL